MKREAATVPDDLALLIDGAIAAGVMDSQSSAVREILTWYFATNLEQTAALLATSDAVTVSDAVSALDVNRAELEQVVEAINSDPEASSNILGGIADSFLSSPDERD